jgi:hypothetical protein
MIVIPQLKPPLLKDLEVNFGTSVANAIWKKMVAHQNYINANVPIGLIIHFFGSGVYPLAGTFITEPDSNWQYCDGSVVTNTASPLFGENVPDLRGRFLKGAALAGVLGGASIFSLAHNHGGATGTVVDIDTSTVHTQRGSDVNMYSWHNHPIANDLGVFSKLPFYMELQPYMRIV